MRAAPLVLAILALSARADAQAPAPEPYRMPVSPALPDRSLSVTVSPVHLLFPMLEGTVEYRLGPRLGLAGVAGLGSISVESGADSTRFVAVEAGASVRYYPLGSFQGGLQVGAEALYVYLAVDESTTSVVVSGASDGLSLGPFVGYKWTGRSGFTFDGQLGLAVAAYHAHAEDSAGGSSSADSSSVFPLLNLNVGWSF